MNSYTLIIFISCLLVRIKGPAVDTVGLCLNGWTNYRSSCYKIVNHANLTWQKARNACQSLQADLVTIENVSQNNFLKMLADFQAPKAKYVWLGLHRNRRDNQFYWINGTRAVYTNWASSSNSGDCVVMDLKINPGKWESCPCLHFQKGPIIYMCEK